MNHPKSGCSSLLLQIPQAQFKQTAHHTGWNNLKNHQLIEVTMAERICHNSYEPIMQRLLRWKRIQSRKRTEKQSKPDTALSPLESLPMELMQMILDQLDVVSLVCMKNTTTGFRALIPPIDEKNLSRCQKWLIMCRFETDMREYPPFVACAFCKVKRPRKDFGVHHSKYTRWTGIRNKDHCGMGFVKPMSLHPTNRYCYRHITSSFGWPPAYREAEKVKWVHTPEPTCLHCGSKPASCGQFALNFMNGPKTHSHCTQTCGVCPTRYLSTFSRHGPIKSARFSSKENFMWSFCGQLEGRRIWMKEWHGNTKLPPITIEVTIYNTIFDSPTISYHNHLRSRIDREAWQPRSTRRRPLLCAIAMYIICKGFSTRVERIRSQPY